jgi:hypothetical protein
MHRYLLYTLTGLFSTAQKRRENMFSRTAWLVGVTTGLLLTVALDSADAKERSTKGTFSGTFLGTRIDLFPTGKPDGNSADWSTAVVESNLGKASAQAVAEAVPTGPTTACPGGVFVIDAEHGVGFATTTVTFAKGAQTYNQIRTRTVCVDTAGRFTGSDTGVTLGGTGKYTGATGTFEQSFTGFFQAFDPNADPAQGFGSFTGQFTGTLILP